MVLSAPPADAQPGARPVAPWIERIANLLRLLERGIVLLVDGAVPAQLGPLVRGLCVENPGLLVLTRAADIEAAPPGSLIVLAVRVEHAIWLNVARPIFAERALRVVLWSTADTTRELARRAPDFFDWIARRIECPPGPPAFTVMGLQAALRARSWAVSFRGDGLEEAFTAAFPRRGLTRADATLPVAALMEVARRAGRGWIAWSNVVDDLAIRRVREVASRAGRRGRNLLDNPIPEVQDAWPVAGIPANLMDAAAALENAGATAAARLSALLDLEPEAVNLAVELLRAGIPASDMEAVLRGAADPGAALGRMAGERSGIDPVLVAAYRVPGPLLRAFAADPRVRRASAVLAGTALPALPLLTERLPADESGAAEFGRLMLQLLKLRIGTGRLIRDSPRGDVATGALAPDGFPPLTGAVAFHFHWPHEGAADVKSALWRASRDKKLRYWVLLTPWDLAPEEREWARGSWRKPGLDVLQWGQTWIDQALRKRPALLARYYPREARAYLPGYDGTDFGTLAASYRERVARLHNRLKTIGIPPEVRPRESRVELPLVDLFIPLRLLGETQGATPGDLASVLSNARPKVILADPGMGKSTLLSYLALVFSGAVALEGFDPPPRALPLFISLREFVRSQRQRPGLSFIDHLCTQAKDGLDLPSAHPAFFEAALRMGEAVVLFDGLDEVGNESARREVAASIEAFRSEYPDCRIWVTSRIHGYTPEVRLPEPFSHFRIDPLDDAQIDGFIARWYAHQIAASPHEAREQAESLGAAVRRTPGVRRLAANPLLLTLMAFIHHGLRRLPRDRGELYEKCIEMLLRTWQEAKGGDGEPGGEAEGISLDVSAQRDYLAHLALYSQERNQGGAGEEARGLLPRREVIDTLAARHLTRGRRERPDLAELQAREEMERFLDHVCDQTGLLVDRGDDQIAFVHLTFQEYLAAWVFLCDSQVPQGPSFFVEHIGDPAWEEVLLLRLYVLLRQGGGVAGFDEVVSAVLRSLEQKSTPEGWLTLVRAVRDDLDFSDRDTRRILGRVVEVWLEEPVLEGQWYSALEEVSLFSERARGKLRGVIASQRAGERDPARVIASVHVEVSLLGWSDGIADALRARGDLEELLPDLVPFVDVPAIRALLADRASVATWARALLSLDALETYRATVRWMTDVPAHEAAEAATAMVWGKIFFDLRSREAFAAPRRAHKDAYFLDQPGTLASERELFSATLPFSCLRALPVSLPPSVPPSVRPLLCDPLGAQRWSQSMADDPWIELSAWTAGWLRGALGRSDLRSPIDADVLERMATRFVRCFMPGLGALQPSATDPFKLRDFLRDFAPYLWGEHIHDGRVPPGLARSFSRELVGLLPVEVVRTFVRAVCRSGGRVFCRTLGVDGRQFHQEWDEYMEKAIQAEPFMLGVLENDYFWRKSEMWANPLAKTSRESTRALQVALRHPLAWHWALEHLWNLAANHLFLSASRHLGIGHLDPKLRTLLRVHRESLPRYPLEIYATAFAWEEHCKTLRNLPLPSAALAISHSAYAALMTGLDCPLPFTPDLTDPRVRVSSLLHELCHFRDPEENVRKLQQEIDSPAPSLRPLLEVAGLLPPRTA